MCSQPFSSLEYYFNKPMDDPIICYSNMDLGYEGGFEMLGEKVDNFLFLGYLSGYDTFLDP